MAELGSRDWHSVRVKVDLSIPPRTVDLSPKRGGAVVQIVFGIAWTVFIWSMLIDVRQEDLPVLLFAMPFSLIGLGLALNGLATLRRKRSAVFRGVEVEGRGLWGAESWYQPYTAFRGVLHREEVVKRKNSSTTYQIVELLHDDPKRCVLLYVRPTTKLPRERWENYARLLKLPARGNSGRELVIASDRGPVHVGLGLSKEALAWLKDFLTAAIATA